MCIRDSYCAAYVHFNKKLGTILGFNKEVPAEVAHTVAMQATACLLYTSRCV